MTLPSFTILAAESIRNAYADPAPARWVHEGIAPSDVDAAYAIQHENTRAWTQAGRRIVGHKIGLTSPAVQRQLGVDQPDFGVLFADMACCDGEDIALSRLRRPRVEGEVALMVGKDLLHADLTLSELIGAVEYALPAIEVVDTRYESWKITLADTIADNASSGLFVIGATPVPLDRVDLGATTMALHVDGKEASSGEGRNCLGHPLHAAVWLARTLAKLGTPVRAGHLVMTGALGPMVDIGAAAQVRCAVQGLGELRCRFV